MTVMHNSLVTLRYHLSTSKGESIERDEELLYLHGDYGQLFDKVERALEGKAVGDTVHVELSAEDAFGEYDGSLVIEEALSELPEALEVGMEIDGYLESTPDDVIVYTVREIRENEAVLDGNHPLAGQPLLFEATVAAIQPMDESAVSAILNHEHD